MATKAAQMMLQCVFEGSISMHDSEIARRPYHKNCGCALHSSKGACFNSCPTQRKLSFLKKQSWSNCSLSISAASSHLHSLPRDSSDRNKEDFNWDLSYR